jgi:hypothetical protein
MFLLGLFSLISWIIKKRKIINLSIKQMQQRFDGDSCSFLFNLTDNDIINKNLKNGNIVSIKYKEFAKCIESKDVILVVTNLKQFVFIPKKNLNSSENEKIINIIKDKGIKYKRVKYIHN